jgi:murein L,D-transpeptidase YafK
VSQRFQKFLHISYPNERDKAFAARYGRSAGGHVGIHGDKGGLDGFIDRFNPNWTDGCITVRNHEIEEIFALVPAGTPIRIDP